MSELKAWTTRQSTGEEPVRYSIHFDHFSSLKMTRIVNEQYPSTIEQMRIHDNVVVEFATHLLSAGGKKVEPDLMHLSSSTKLKWESFLSHQLGRGWVAYKRSLVAQAAGDFGRCPVLIHDNSENTDPDVMRVVENECAMLAYLLNKFRFDDEFISEQTKSSAMVPSPLHLTEFKWKELAPGTYKIRGILKTGPVRYALQYEEGDRKDELFLHHVESNAMIDESLLDTEVIATVLKLPDWSAALLAVEPYVR